MRSHGVDGVPAGEQHPGLLQGRGGPAREVILDDQVLGASPCSQRGRCRCSSPVTWMSIPSQPSAAKAFWTLSWGRGGDFVNHAPGERKLLLGPGVGFGGHVAGGFPGVPAPRKKPSRSFSPFWEQLSMDTKARGAPQASNRARQQAAKAPSSVWASPGARPIVLLHGGVYGVALLRDGDGHHLQAGGPGRFPPPGSGPGARSSFGAMEPTTSFSMEPSASRLTERVKSS